MTHNELPAEAVAWLAAAEQTLRRASAEQTAEIMDGLRSHITEAQLGEEILFTLQIRSDGVETVRRTTPVVSIDAWEGEPIPEELPHRAPRLPWVPAEKRMIEL